MEVHSSSLSLFEPAAVESGIESVKWVQYAPMIIPKAGSSLVFNIPANTTAYTDLSKTILQAKVKVTKADGTHLASEDDAALVNLALSSLFAQCDVSLNQRPINTSIGPNYPYKAYLDVLLNSNPHEVESVLQNELFYKDTAGSMDENGVTGGNIGHYERMLHIANSKVLVLEGPIRMDICQQERLIINGVRLNIKLTQADNAFRLMSSGKIPYKVDIVDAVLKLCQVHLNPGILIAQSEALQKVPALYPVRESDVKTFNIERGSYDWRIEDTYRGRIPNDLVIALCTNEAYSGSYGKNPFNFQHFNLNYLEVTVNGIPTPCEPLKPNFKEGDYTSCYTTLFDWAKKSRGLIERKDYPEGYCIYRIALQNHTSEGLHSTVGSGNLRIALKFSEPVKENVTVILYAKFSRVVTINDSRNIEINL